MELLELRDRIDNVDTQLLKLIEERMNIVNEVAEYKRKNDLPIFVPERENEILERLASRIANPEHRLGLKLLYGIIMDLNKLNEYHIAPKDIEIPTGLGGASVRAILPNTPGSLCRYISPLAAANISIVKITSTSLPGCKLLVDIEAVGDTSQPNFVAALSVLADTSEKFTIL